MRTIAIACLGFVLFAYQGGDEALADASLPLQHHGASRGAAGQAPNLQSINLRVANLAR